MKQFLMIICGVYLFLYLLGFLMPQKTTHPVLQRLSKPVTIAHQGGNKVYPDESLLAFTNAINMGIQVIEFDVHRTKDGIIVINHDQTIDRLTDGSGLIREMSWVELQQVDGAYNWSPDGLTYPAKVNTNTGQVEIYEGDTVGGKEQQKKIDNRDNLMKKMLSSKYDELMDE